MNSDVYPLSFSTMDNLSFNIWLFFGLICIIVEFLLPGLVVVFLGLGSLTVALLMHLGYVDSITNQFIIFFLSSIFYLLTLRFLILKLVPTNVKKVNIDEDLDAIGSVVEVVTEILPEQVGRIEYAESTWQAKTMDNTKILKGEKAKIVGRENITWIVQKI